MVFSPIQTLKKREGRAGGSISLSQGEIEIKRKTRAKFTIHLLLCLLLLHSPDGSKIAYMSSDIWIINRDGTGRRQLTHGGCGATLTWSPDGEKIAFIWYEKTGQGYFGPIHKPYLKIIDVNTGKIESFALKHGLQHLSFSPCGKWLVGSGFGALYKVNIETKREKRIIGRPRIGHKCPQYYWPDWR